MLTRGLGPADLMKVMGFEEAARELEKKYNQNQPRVPAGSGAESGRWTSGGGAGAAPRIVQRVDVNVVGATRSDANPPGIVSGAQYAQANPTPVISAKDMKHVEERHFFDSTAKDAGKFTPEYSNEQAIRQLVEDAWKQATPQDIGAGYFRESTVIAAQVLDVIDGAPTPHIIGISAERRSVPSIPTSVYVVILDRGNNVKSVYPINPLDKINPRDE